MNMGKTAEPVRRVLFGLAKDHLELAKLEWAFEREQWWRRFIARGVGAVFYLTGYVFSQIALMGWLIRRGMSIVGAGFMLGGLYLLLGLVVAKFCNDRDSIDGGPMRATRNEIARSFNWIEKHFF
jgi:uncharacterized membrane protein YqjE